MLSWSRKRCGDGQRPPPLNYAGVLLFHIEAVFSVDAKCIGNLFGNRMQGFAQCVVFLYQFFSCHLVFTPNLSADFRKS